VRHPWFVSPLDWHAHLDEALAAARADGKRVFLLCGRASCGGSRALVERTLAKDEIAEYTAQHFVLMASDADAPAPEVAALVDGLAQKAPTPVCIYLDGDGRLLGSTAGGRPPAVLLNDLLGIVARKLV
jgi:hypothetical protein